MTALCPICKAESSTIIGSSSAHDAAVAFAPPNLDEKRFRSIKRIIENLWPEHVSKRMFCKNCDLTFADPFIAGSAEFYQAQAPDTDYPVTKFEFEETIKALSKIDFSDNANLLEIGAGKGYFVRQLISNRWNPNHITTTEFSDKGRKAIELLGVESFPVDVRELITDKKFDVFCLFQVLEHLDRFEELFAKFDSLATKEAHLFIAVPYGKRIEFNESIGLLLDMPPNHLTQWSEKSFVELGKAYHWKVINYGVDSLGFVKNSRYAFVNRFVRQSQDKGTWANTVFLLTKNVQNKKLSRILKLGGACLSLTSWNAGLKAANFYHKNGSLANTIWVHLKRNQ